jgi:uncharacterized protein (TIGR02996 family)
LDPGLLRAVIEAPDDDYPRMLAADWLDEHGEPERAEFIRVQCELAKGCGCDDRLSASGRCVCRRCRLDRRQAALLEHRNNYLRWLPGLVVGATRHGLISFRLPEAWSRGFVSQLTLSWQDWQAHAAALLAACPLANAKDGCVRLTTWPDLRLFEIAGQPMALIHGTDKAVRVNSIEEAEGDRRTLILGLLGAIWNGVHFEFPRTWRPVGDARVRPDHTAAR